MEEPSQKRNRCWHTSDRTSKNGLNAHYTSSNLLVGGQGVDGCNTIHPLSGPPMDASDPGEIIHDRIHEGPQYLFLPFRL